MSARTAPGGHDGARLIAVTLLIAYILGAGCLDGLPFPDISRPLVPAGPGDNGRLKAYFLDVGQGDSTVILFPNKTILIDAGDTEHGDTVVSDLRLLGVTRINLLVATHPHSDHIGGMQDVLAAFPVDQVLDAGIPHTSVLYESFLSEIEEKDISYRVAERGQSVDLDPALRIIVLSPPKDSTLDGLNENSVVLRVSYGTVDLLFTGDAGNGAESALLSTGYPLDAEILKTGHHGSSDATGEKFLARVNPEVAVISVGAGNEYGHPHAETLDLLESARVTVCRTDHDGTVLVASDGSTWTVRTERGAGSFSGLVPSAETVAAPAATTAATGRPVITGTTAAPATGTVAPVGTVPAVLSGNASFITISAVQFNAPGDDRENLNGEWVRLTNTGDGMVLLAGWTLSDNTGDVVYRFPPFLLEPDRTVTIYTGPGEYNTSALFMGRTEPVWGNSGDEAVLEDAAGTVVDRHDGDA